KDERNREREGEVMLRRLVLPQLRRHGAEGEVYSEKSREEHDLATQPHDGAYGNDVRPLHGSRCCFGIHSARCHSSIMAENLVCVFQLFSAWHKIDQYQLHFTPLFPT